MDQHPWHQSLTFAAQTDVGLRRSNNQDSFGQVLASNDEVFGRRGHMFIVADGMGAHAAGELASKMAVDNSTLAYYKLPDKSPADALRKAIEEANAKIHARGQANPDFRGMGTTSSVLVLLPRAALVGHVGDSRVYRLRGNRFEQLTADHSLVWEMMVSNHLSEAELPGYIPKNVITRSLGPSDSVKVDVEGPFPLADGDLFLLCSDGLSGQVNDDELGVILGLLPPAEAAQVLIDLANLRGGPDNITVEIVQVNNVREFAARAKNSREEGEPLNPLWWVALGVLTLLTLILLASGHPLPAIGSGVLALGASLWVLIQKLGGSSGEASANIAQQGAGPHRSWICPVNAAMVERLSGVVDPVCQMAREQGWEIDWPRFEGYRQRAQAALQRQDLPGAAREHCQAISFLMQEVRDQRHRSTGAPIDIDGP